LEEKKVMSLRQKYVNSTLLNKECTKCGNTYPRDDQYFYRVKLGWDCWCITCRNENSNQWKKNNKKRKTQINLKYRETEKGYFGEMFNQMKKSKYYVESEFPDTESLINHWNYQKEKTGLICPGSGIKMTMVKGKRKPTDTNISKDRLLPWEGYTKTNTIFVAWKYNNDKKAITPKNAMSYLKLVEERFHTVDIDA